MLTCAGNMGAQGGTVDVVQTTFHHNDNTFQPSVNNLTKYLCLSFCTCLVSKQKKVKLFRKRRQQMWSVNFRAFLFMTS